MAFAKRPSAGREPATSPKHAAKLAAPAAPPPVPAQVTSLFDDPEAASPIGTMLRIAGLVAVLFVLALAIALWMKPADWWDQDAALGRQGAPALAQMAKLRTV